MKAHNKRKKSKKPKQKRFITLKRQFDKEDSARTFSTI